MLQGNLYDILDFLSEDGRVVATVRLRSDCEIFKGHFPGTPITPGVCLVQIAKELAEKTEGCRLHLPEAKDIKFVSLVTPDKTPEIRYELVRGEKNAEGCKWQVSLYSAENLCCKMSLILCD